MLILYSEDKDWSQYFQNISIKNVIGNTTMPKIPNDAIMNSNFEV